MAFPGSPLTFPLAGALSRPLNTVRRWASAGGGGPWSPADVTLTSSMIWEVVDAVAPLYTNSAGTTAATANADPINYVPIQRGATIANKAYPNLRSYLDNGTYAAALLTTDGTHARAIRCANSADPALFPAGAFPSEYTHTATTSLFAARIRADLTGATEPGFTLYGSDNGTFALGPGILAKTFPTLYEWGAAFDAQFNSSTVDVVDDTWVTIVVTGDQTDGMKMYINDPVTPAYTNASLKPVITTQRSLGLRSGAGLMGFDLHRLIFGNGIDLAEASVADVMTWLEANS